MSTALPAPPSAPQTTPAAAVPLAAPVRRVTLLEDRAQVRREGQTPPLGPGSHRLVIAGVAPVVADRTLVARAGDGARVLEARVVRRLRIGRAEQRPPAAKVAAEQEALDAEGRRLQLELRLARTRLERTQHALSLMIDAVNREVLFAAAFEERWARDVDGLLVAARELEERQHALRLELQDLGQRRAVAGMHEAQLEPDGALETSIEVELLVDRPCAPALTVDYMVPCALWRPAHRAALLGTTARFECEAAVWQATGEDWEDVELLFSTARPTQRAEPPRLADDRLAVQRRQEKKVTVAVREEEIATTGEGAEARRSADLPGVDDGGETRTLPAATRASIRTTGLLHRIPVFAFEAPAEVDRIARPERSVLVHLRSKQPNAAPHPILAGPVDLLRESGYVGRGEVGFVAPGERFVLGWGADDGLRVRREVAEEREVARLTGKQTITRKVTLALSNLEPTPATFLLEERVPVSELEQVKVEVDPKLTAPPAQPDAQGIVAWTVTVPGRGTREVTLGYRLTAPGSVQGL
ncbi:MAG: mucoidy inhibitor MuiA family protein [Planctomycetes bacterium]|nr:mucoidy inhibitor MuiA family protein [Planctomycetota bacterium]